MTARLIKPLAKSLAVGMLAWIVLAMPPVASAGCPGIGPLPPAPGDEACALEDPAVATLFQQLRDKVLEVSEVLSQPKMDDARMMALGQEIAALQSKIMALRAAKTPGKTTQ